MGSNPINLGLRFILEIAVMFALGNWGWIQFEGVWRFVVAIGLVVLAAVIWGTFAVPNDPSRSGQAPVPVPGWVRLVLELVYFALGVLAFFASGMPVFGYLLAGLTIIHYALSYDRIEWLLMQ